MQVANVLGKNVRDLVESFVMSYTAGAFLGITTTLRVHSLPATRAGTNISRLRVKYYYPPIAALIYLFVYFWLI